MMSMLIYLSNISIYHRAFILHMLIGLGNTMTFGFTRSKIKDTMVLYVNTDFYSFVRTAYHRTTIFHMLFGLGRII